jgi:hypothetical protein
MNRLDDLGLNSDSIASGFPLLDRLSVMKISNCKLVAYLALATTFGISSILQLILMAICLQIDIRAATRVSSWNSTSA